MASRCSARARPTSPTPPGRSRTRRPPLCEEDGIEFTELQVATDALTVVVSAENDFITCLTTEELATLWGPDAEGTVTTWDQVNPDFPAEPIELYGPGTDSGTFDYFTERDQR